jgi:hypothetical protein
MRPQQYTEGAVSSVGGGSIRLAQCVQPCGDVGRIQERMQRKQFGLPDVGAKVTLTAVDPQRAVGFHFDLCSADGAFNGFVPGGVLLPRHRQAG